MSILGILPHLREDADEVPGAGGAWGIWSGERRLATATVERQDGGGAPVLGVRIVQPLQCSSDDARQIVAGVIGHARELQVRHVDLDTIDPLVRHEARLARFDGPLRQPLRGNLEILLGPSPLELGTTDTEALAREVGRLVGVQVTVRPAGGWLAKMARGAVAGFGDMVNLVVQGGAGDRDFTLAVPNRADVLPESLGLAVDTLLGVRRRFGRAIYHLRLVSFDHASHGLKVGSYAGQAQTNVGIIHLNASYALAAELEEQRRPHPVLAPEFRFSGSAIPPYSTLERTAAHEAWHQIEGAFEARDYKRSIEMRRRLGAHFGVETLEHAILGRKTDAPPAWKAAQAQLVQEVSDYGGTLPGEATAEMFKNWWCPVVPASPAVRLFGQLVEEYLPPPD